MEEVKTEFPITENNEIIYITNNPNIIPLKEVRTSRNNLLSLIITSNTIEKEEEPQDTQCCSNTSSYRLSLKWYCIYIMYGFFGGIFINIISSSLVINFDMVFNILLSPIIYYNAPRKILTRITIKELALYYTIPFIFGLCFRFLDYIPIFRNFTLNVSNISNEVQILLLSLVIIFILAMILYYIYISTEPLINLLLFIIMVLIGSISCYYYYINGGNIYFHHYFIGIIIMLISKNPKHKIVIMTHAIGYAVYIEGISKWGYAPIFWKN
jgi:hypothetical protein